MIIESVGGFLFFILLYRRHVSEAGKCDESIQKQDIFRLISLEVSPHKLTAFIGPNGAGKSTLLHHEQTDQKGSEFLSIQGVKSSWNSQN